MPTITRCNWRHAETHPQNYQCTPCDCHCLRSVWWLQKTRKKSIRIMRNIPWSSAKIGHSPCAVLQFLRVCVCECILYMWLYVWFYTFQKHCCLVRRQSNLRERAHACFHYFHAYVRMCLHSVFVCKCVGATLSLAFSASTFASVWPLLSLSVFFPGIFRLIFTLRLYKRAHVCICVCV